MLKSYNLQDEANSSLEFRRSLKIDVAFEIIDASIEIKNGWRLGHDVQNLYSFNDEVSWLFYSEVSAFHFINFLLFRLTQSLPIVYIFYH